MGEAAASEGGRGGSGRGRRRWGRERDRERDTERFGGFLCKGSGEKWFAISEKWRWL
jgi:hypothetical protein